jgi:uncharacterized protein
MDRPSSLDQHQVFADSLTTSVRNIHHYWIEERRRQIARGEMPGVIGQREPFRRAPKIGRNDPCPCGSGKKYKRCHGAANDPKNIGHTVERVHDEQVRADMADSLIQSPLSQRIVRDGTAVEIEIYEDSKGGWLLEIVDEFWNSTIWDESFPTDTAALQEALRTIDNEGIASVIGDAPAGTTRH